MQTDPAGPEIAQCEATVRWHVAKHHPDLSTDEVHAIAHDAVAEAVLHFDPTKGSLPAFARHIAHKRAIDAKKSPRHLKKSHATDRDLDCFGQRPEAYRGTDVPELFQRVWNREMIPEEYYEGEDRDARFWRALRHIDLDREGQCWILAVAAHHDAKHALHKSGVELSCSVESLLLFLKTLPFLNEQRLRQVLPALVDGEYLHVTALGVDLHPRVRRRWSKLLKT